MSYLLCRALDRLLDQVHKIRRAKLSEGLETICPYLDDGMLLILVEPNCMSACAGPAPVQWSLLRHRCLNHTSDGSETTQDAVDNVKLVV